MWRGLEEGREKKNWNLKCSCVYTWQTDTKNVIVDFTVRICLLIRP